MDYFESLKLEVKKSREAKKEARQAAAKMLAGPRTTLPDDVKSLWEKSVKPINITWKK